MINIVAKPLTELVPKINKTIAAKIVVIFASKIVVNERLLPAFAAEATVSCPQFFLQTFIRDDIRIDSHSNT